MFLKATGSQVLVFSVAVSFDLYPVTSMHAMINPCILFDLFSMYIDHGVRVWWCLGEGTNFQLGTYGASKLQKEQFDANF